jgi:ERCC4-related helicase
MLAPLAEAAVSISPVFGTNMVLQRGKAIPVSGTAAANKAITVTFNGQTKSTTSDAAGKWQIALDPMAAKVTGGNLTAQEAGANTVTLGNVVVGDVWICGGQSNMDMVLGSCDRQVDIDTANFPVMRQFRDGSLAVLVSTTVIEVGVDVPNATIMIIEEAGRFGLSQIHQLRGRIGRGSLKSWCILLQNDATGPALEKLRVL